MILRFPARLAVCLAALSWSCAATADPLPGWHDTPQSRLVALALVQTLNAELLAGNSATLGLERWCREHALAAPATIEARKIAGVGVAASDQQRRHLQVDDAEPLSFRRVELRCGSHVLSIADNWYVPGRLTPDMNRLLDETDTPFGRVVLPLQPPMTFEQTTKKRFVSMALPGPT